MKPFSLESPLSLIPLALVVLELSKCKKAHSGGTPLTSVIDSPLIQRISRESLGNWTQLDAETGQQSTGFTRQLDNSVPAIVNLQ